MIKEYEGRVKVKSSVKPLDRKDRKAPELKIGEPYYVSFGTNSVYRCILNEIIIEFNEPKVEVEVIIKPRHRRQYLYPGYWAKLISLTYRLLPTSIGVTPEDAVRNSV